MIDSDFWSSEIVPWDWVAIVKVLRETFAQLKIRSHSCGAPTKFVFVVSRQSGVIAATEEERRMRLLSRS